MGTSIRESLWVFPIINGIDVLGLALSIGIIVWFDLRLAGWSMRHKPISELWGQLLPWSILGFTVMFASGGLLFWSEAVRAWSNVFFKIKLIFMLLAGLNALLYQFTIYRSMTEWDKWPVPPLQARLAGVLSMILGHGYRGRPGTTAYTF